MKKRESAYENQETFFFMGVILIHGECTCKKMLQNLRPKKKTCLEWSRVHQIDRFYHEFFFFFKYRKRDISSKKQKIGTREHLYVL